MMTYARDQAAPPLGGQEGLPLARKSVLIIEDEALIALVSKPVSWTQVLPLSKSPIR